MKTLLITFLSFSALACIKEPIKQLENLKPAEKIKLNFSNLTKNYTLSPFNYFGIHNHFQGIFKHKNMIYISGGNKSASQADLFIFKDKKPLKKITLNRKAKHWHAGSFQMYDQKLIIPIERLNNPLTSQIISFDMGNQKIENLFLKKTNKTGAIDFLEKDMIVLFDPKEISFYSFPDFNQVKSINKHFFTGSSAKIIHSCDKKIYFANITNDGVFPPIINGNNIVSLFLLDKKTYKLTKFKEIKFPHSNSNFRGAANMTLKDGQINIIASEMYLDIADDTLDITIFK